MPAYRIVVHHPTLGAFHSEPLELNDSVRKNLIERLGSYAAGYEVLTFDDDLGNKMIFPPSMGCVVELRRKEENEQDE